MAILYFPLKQTIHPPDRQDLRWLKFVETTVPGDDIDTQEELKLRGNTLLQGDFVLESIIKARCEQRNIPFLSLRPALEEWVKKNRENTYYRYDIHWNKNGNRCVGQAVGMWLQELGDWVPTNYKSVSSSSPASQETKG